jgi:hypothetical protein
MFGNRCCEQNQVTFTFMFPGGGFWLSAFGFPQIGDFRCGSPEEALLVRGGHLQKPMQTKPIPDVYPGIRESGL